MLNFDPTLTLGAVMNAGVLLAGFIVAFTRIGGRIDLLSQRLAAVEETLKNNRDVNERLAIIETRQATHGNLIVNLQNDQQDLKRGRGFITDRSPSGGINGEW